MKTPLLRALGIHYECDGMQGNFISHEKHLQRANSAHVWKRRHLRGFLKQQQKTSINWGFTSSLSLAAAIVRRRIFVAAAKI
jgi:hypothetical protein